MQQRDTGADKAAPGAARVGRRRAFAQLGQSLDGFIATRTGDAVFVTGEEDRRHLHRLRLLRDPTAPTLWLLAEDAPDPGPVARHVEVVRLARDAAGRFPPRQLLEALARLVAQVTAPVPENRRYLGTKRDRLGHDLPVDADISAGPETEEVHGPLR